VVALDPRLHATQQDLAARLALDLQIHADLDALDKDINQALVARDKLQKAVSAHSVTDAQAAGALAALNRDIDSVAQMAMKSSEGGLLFETKLRDHLAYLAADIDLSYDQPTASQNAVFHELDQQAKEGEQKLEADVAEADKMAGHPGE
jgi:septum formation topological specificity factor MinE